jgi:multiple sugar transport system ATP-binding protein
MPTGDLTLSAPVEASGATADRCDVAIERVTKRYKNSNAGPAVDDVSLTIGNGEFMVLVGPSGCGKTTLLRMIAGLETITSGRIAIGGRDVTNCSPKDRDIAMVFQDYALYPQMTVEQNLSFGLRLRKVPRNVIRARVLEAAETLDLTSYLKRKPTALSGGQRQRVAIGRAIVRQPRVFLLDEPLSNLDAKLRVHMRAELARLRDHLRVTTIYVTHDQVEAMTLGERVAVLDRGSVQQVDAPENLFRHPRNLFVAGFIGSPAMNFAVSAVANGTLQLADIGFPAPSDVTLGGRTRVVLGIRPNDFEDAALGIRPEWPRLTVRADVVERLGTEVHVLFSLDADPAPRWLALGRDSAEPDDASGSGAGGRARFVARVDAASTVRSGDLLDLSVNVGGVHCFDIETGETLRRDRDTGGAL